MKVTISVDVEIRNPKLLAGILKTSEKQLDTKLVSYARAAVEEYLEMFSGERAFTRGSDIIENRLFLLIRNAYPNGLPDEARISSLFQCTRPKARALLQAVMSKYRYQLTVVTESTLASVLAGVENNENGPGWFLKISNEAVAAEINSRLALIDGSLDQLTKRSGKIGQYELQNSSYRRLCEELKLQPKAKPR